MEIDDIISSGILESYAAGLSSEKESEEVKRWLIQYPGVADELKSISDSIEAYIRINAIDPSPVVKEKVFAQINEKGKISIAGNKNTGIKPVEPFWKLIAAASILLLMGSIIFNLANYNNYSDLRIQLLATRQSLDALKESNKDMSAHISVVQSKYSVPVALNGLKEAPDAAAKVFWMKNTGEVFIDAGNLPPAPAGKQYQLWGIVNGKPVSGGMLLKTKKGNTFLMQKMKSFGKAEAFAITLEPEKGNPSPQGPMYVMGKM